MLSKKGLRFIVADDHAIVRKGLSQILTDEFVGANITEAKDGQSVLRQIRSKDFDLLICDISMPGVSGLELCKRVRELQPVLPVLVLSMHAEETYAIRALKAGASGYLTKESAPEELITAIYYILSGKKYVTSSLASLMADHIGNLDKLAPHELLSDRELEVMKLIATGVSLTNIGAQLNLSPNTISTYRSRIMEKMNLKSNADLVRYVTEYL